MIPHLKERIEYARDELAWLEKGAPEGEGPWLEWEHKPYPHVDWINCRKSPSWDSVSKYRRRPKMLHVIDAKGKRWEFPEPMREAPAPGTRYWYASIYTTYIVEDSWCGGQVDRMRLEFGLCQSTEEGAQMQVAALRAVCLGGEV